MLHRLLRPVKQPYLPQPRPGLQHHDAPDCDAFAASKPRHSNSQHVAQRDAEAGYQQRRQAQVASPQRQRCKGSDGAGEEQVLSGRACQCRAPNNRAQYDRPEPQHGGQRPRIQDARENHASRQSDDDCKHGNPAFQAALHMLRRGVVLLTELAREADELAAAHSNPRDCDEGPRILQAPSYDAVFDELLEFGVDRRGVVRSWVQTQHSSEPGGDAAEAANVAAPFANLQHKQRLQNHVGCDADPE
mmetsp:Transcript_51149/g.148873  ORF Transcript_51149/g.148873 Transcript_51149/m.148873 type:complete len:246 (-) Transcript_51149:75-812(-)